MNEANPLVSSWNPLEILQVQRLENLTDGIFAVAMTILVFDLKPLDGPVGDLPSNFVHLWPNFLGYIISFLLLGIYWHGHLSQFRHIRKIDPTYIWIHILFFMSISLVPFTTSSLSQYPFSLLTLALYASNLILIGCVLYAMWSYATNGHRFIDDNVPPEVIRYGKIRCLLAPAGYVIALCVALVSPVLALIVFVIVPVVYIVPGFHSFWVKLTAG